MVNKVSVTIIATGLSSLIEEKVLDFPSIQVQQPAAPREQRKSKPDENIEDIFARIGINQNSPKDDNSEQDEESMRHYTPRTDLPSFLKALD